MTLDRLSERFLDLHRAMRPVDSTFMGFEDLDHALPPADDSSLEREVAELAALARELERTTPEPTAAARVAHAALHAALQHARAEHERRPRVHNPAWYTGEAAFGVVSLLLREPSAHAGEALQARVKAMPDFFAAGQARLGGRPTPEDWVTRARTEANAVERLLSHGLKRHGLHGAVPAQAVKDAADAAQRFAASLTPDPAADPAAPEGYLTFLLREVHRLPFTAPEAEELALEGFERARAELVGAARALDPNESWRAQLARLEHDHPDVDEVIPTYERLHAEAMERADAAGLVTPATRYGLTFAHLPAWAHEVAGDLYFLFYRSPAALRPGVGSMYWVFPSGADRRAYLRSQNRATIKVTHAVHHGSIGHHTQNARAREAEGLLGRVAGTDCASGIALASGGTMIEGWACYVQDLLLEAHGFYTPQEELLLKHAELRNAAMCLADVRLHSGAWNLEQMRAFYRDEVGLGGPRLWAETTRNSMWPGTRAMYWLGTRTIRETRRELSEDARRFHDRLLSYGSVPVTTVTDEMRAAKRAAAARAPRGAPQEESR